MQYTSKHIAKLLQRCSRGEQSAQFEIYKLYYKAMYNTSLRILHNSFEAEDVMQESFLVAFTKLGTFKGEVAFGAWLKRIVINKSITQYRKNHRHEEVSLEVVKEQSDASDSICDEEMTEASVQRILECVNKLKDNYRVALTLHLIEGYDYEEISEIMNVSYQNSRTMISRAKHKLKELVLVDYER